MADFEVLVGFQEHVPLPALLQNATDDLEKLYSLGKKLGEGQFGTTYLCTERATGLQFACKCIPKRKLISSEEIEDVGREVEVMYHLSGHPNIVTLKGAYEDATNVYLVMELCEGGELFDRIIERGTYTEAEADIWSAGVMLYILLSGAPPFWAETVQGIFEKVMEGEPPTFTADPWPNISEVAKDLIRKMLDPNPEKRLKAHEVLNHPWIREDGVAPKKPIASLVQFRMKQFAAMNKLKKLAIRIIAETLSEEEIANLKEIFTEMDSDNDGAISFEELKAGLLRVGTSLKDAELFDLMDAADVDHDGMIDCGEFLAATLSLNHIELEENLMAAFQYLDKSGSGYITTDELLAVCFEFHMEDVRLEDLLHDVSIGADGSIDYKMFVTMMRKCNGGMGHQNLRCTLGITDVLTLEEQY